MQIDHTDLERIRQATELIESTFEALQELGVQPMLPVPMNARDPVAITPDHLDLRLTTDKPSGLVGTRIVHCATVECNYRLFYKTDQLLSDAIEECDWGYQYEDGRPICHRCKLVQRGALTPAPNSDEKGMPGVGHSTSQTITFAVEPKVRLVASTYQPDPSQSDLPFPDDSPLQPIPDPRYEAVKQEQAMSDALKGTPGVGQPDTELTTTVTGHVCEYCNAGEGETHDLDCGGGKITTDHLPDGLCPECGGNNRDHASWCDHYQPVENRVYLSKPAFVSSPSNSSPEKTTPGVTQSNPKPVSSSGKEGPSFSKVHGFVPESQIVADYLKKHTAGVTRSEAKVTSLVLNRLQRSARVLHALLGLLTELGELADPWKKHIFYGETVDLTNVSEEVGDLEWYKHLLLDELELDNVEILETNLSKLRARFPDKFTEEEARNRNLNRERVILEGRSEDSEEE